MELYSHQKKIIDKNPAKILIAHSTGSGKSITGLQLAYKNSANLIVICPKSLVKKWENDVKNYYLSGNKDDFEWAFVRSKEEFRCDWDILPKTDCLLIDESHFFHGMKSQMFKNLLKYIKKWKVPYIYLLTATPYLSTPFNIYAAAKILGYDWNYVKFRDTFFYQVWMGSRQIPMIKKGAKEMVGKLVKQIGDVVSLDECVDIPEQVFKNEELELTDEQNRAIKDIKDILPIVKFTKQHQIENGSLKSDGYTENMFFKNEKNDRIIELVTEFKKVAIFCRYNLQIQSIEDAVKKEFKDKKVYTINGASKDRHEIVNSVNASDECVVLINSSCSCGYELPTIDAVVFASLSFSYVDHQQGIGRFLRINKLKKNLYIYLISGEVDKAVYKSIMNKKDFDIEIYRKENI